MTNLQIREHLLKAGVKNLKEFGYPEVTTETILTDEIISQMLYADHVNVCYSEWTCGYGGFDYVIDKGGHSIFKELESYIGKYVHFMI